MSIPFDRQEVRRWERLNDNFSIDFSTTIGRGSYGVVYRGYSRVKDTLVAIKVVASTGLERREIETLESLSSLDHPNIMGFYGQLELNGNTFLVLEYCNRGTLTELIAQGIPEVRVLKLFREMVEGMCYMNARERMHRDFKPDNILIGPQMDIKICDFGLAQSTNSIFVTGKMGTPIYAGPEVFLIHDREAQTYTYTCDVWSAGLILYEMLVGERLFREVQNYGGLKEEWLLYERGIKKAELRAPLHPLWEYFVNWMLQFDYKRRPTFHQVLEGLKRVYDRMQASILGLQSGPSILQELKFELADRFIHFQVAKHQVLVALCEKFTREDIRMSNEYKHVCMFLCILRYTFFARDFIRALRYKRIRADARELLAPSELPELEMFCDRARFPLEHRYEFYNAQLRNTVAAKIVEKYSRRPESQAAMQELEEAVGVVGRYWRGETLPDDHDLKEIFKGVIVSFRKNRDFRKRFNVDEMRLYAHLLVAVLLDERFPEADFERADVEGELDGLARKEKEELEKLIDSMHDDIEH